jgi:ATP-dependent Clp endopeptidase proteolytic subunit ClpP
MPAFYEIHAKAGDSHAEIRIYDEIGLNWWGEGVSAKQMADDLEALDVSTIALRINSPGGSVFEGNTIYNALRRHDATVTTYVDGLAASAASIVALAGDEVIMAPNAMMMIHDAWGFAIGNAADMRKQADTLEKVNATLVATYRGRTGKSNEEILAAMADETWFDAETAVEWGLADRVDGEEQDVAALAHFDPRAIDRYRHAPAALIAALHAPRTAPVVARSADASTPAGRVDNEAAAAHEMRVREIMTER